MGKAQGLLGWGHFCGEQGVGRKESENTCIYFFKKTFHGIIFPHWVLVWRILKIYKTEICKQSHHFLLHDGGQHGLYNRD